MATLRRPGPVRDKRVSPVEADRHYQEFGNFAAGLLLPNGFEVTGGQDRERYQSKVRELVSQHFLNTASHLLRGFIGERHRHYGVGRNTLRAN